MDDMFKIFAMQTRDIRCTGSLLTWNKDENFYQFKYNTREKVQSLKNTELQRTVKLTTTEKYR